jgi:hypothetical protein
MMRDGQNAEPVDALASLDDASSRLKSAISGLRALTGPGLAGPVSAAEIRSAEAQLANRIRGVRDAAFVWLARHDEGATRSDGLSDATRAAIEHARGSDR